MRLTEKNETGFVKDIIYFPSDELENKSEIEISKLLLTKLGQLEDIEEELGIDLLTLFKALSGSYAVKEDDGSIVVEWSCPRFYAPAVFGHGFNSWISIRPRDEEKQLYLKDYGKTWALTREEIKDGH